MHHSGRVTFSTPRVVWNTGKKIISNLYLLSFRVVRISHKPHGECLKIAQVITPKNVLNYFKKIDITSIVGRRLQIASG